MVTGYSCNIIWSNQQHVPFIIYDISFFANQYSPFSSEWWFAPVAEVLHSPVVCAFSPVFSCMYNVKVLWIQGWLGKTTFHLFFKEIKELFCGIKKWSFQIDNTLLYKINLQKSSPRSTGNIDAIESWWLYITRITLESQAMSHFSVCSVLNFFLNGLSLGMTSSFFRSPGGKTYYPSGGYLPEIRWRIDGNFPWSSLSFLGCDL